MASLKAVPVRFIGMKWKRNDEKMNILVICQYYYPEPFRISDICEELVKRGHKVTVVTGTPNYPMGEVYDGYQNGNKQNEIINGVKIYRCTIHPRKSGIVHRLWNYYSYPYASKKYISKFDDSFDVVFINQLSPVMMAQAGIKYAKKYKKKSVLYCLDLWPASLTAGGVKAGVVYKWFYRESKKIYRAVDRILIASKSFADYFEKEFGITDTVYLPQYAEDTFTPEQCRKKPDRYIDLMFAGNVGTAQSVDTIIKAAALCKDIENLRWHIVGDGKEIDNMKKLADEMSVSVIFHGRKLVEEMPTYYAMADAMLITLQKDPVLCLTLPGKLQSYMAAGKPIIGAIDGEAAVVVNDAECGFVGDAENSEKLSDCVRRFVSLAEQVRDNFGKNARNYYLSHFSRDKFIAGLDIELKAMRGE